MCKENLRRDDYGIEIKASNKIVIFNFQTVSDIDMANLRDIHFQRC